MNEQSLQPVGKVPVSRSFQDLGPRLLSGIVLGTVALAITYWGGTAFALLVAAVGGIMSWEWGRIVRGGERDARTAVHVGAVVLAVLLAGAGQVMLAGVTLLVATATVLALSVGGPWLLSSLGVVYAGVPAVALVALRQDGGHGFAAVMLVMAVVWAVDTAAFVGGRSIGGPKLWPSVSPKKTWAGFLTGIAAGSVAGGIGAAMIGASVPRLLLVALVLGIVSQGGDLAESALKRGFGVKDSSGLIPGHGGFLDRLDGVVAAATLAGLIGLITNIAAPARALLFGA